MSEKAIEQIRKEMGEKSTQNLLRIWQTEYREEWSDVEFQVVGEILRARGVDLPLTSKEIDSLHDKLIVSTTPSIEGKQITTYLGVVSSSVVMGTGMLSEISGSFADILGTRAEGFQKKLEVARETALFEIEKKTIDLKGNGIVGINFEYMTLGANMIVVNINGTAVSFSE